MDEIKQLHNLTIEWGCITNLVDRISLLEEKIDGGWTELIEMIADAMSEEGSNKDTASVFFNLYGFLFRLYYRLRAGIEKGPFNSYVHQGDEFWIKNYDYTTYKWAMEHGFKNIDNLIIRIPESQLSEQQRKALAKRCK